MLVEMRKKNTKIRIISMEEVFKDIENYQGLYQISNQGRVYSVKRNKFRIPQKMNNGYLLVVLYKDGKGKNYLVHRLVAQTFIKNPQNLQEVNHINEDKTDNRVENLEFCDKIYNMNYGTRTQRQKEKVSKKVLQFTKQGEFVKEYPSIMEASRQTNINHSNISQCCRGNKNNSHAGGFLWKYKNEEVA